MKPKLKVFQEFSEALLPHEANYLMTLGNFQDGEKRQVFQQLIHNALHPEEQISFDESIDKRKYHYLKNWVQKKLDTKDVDKIGAWLLDFNKKLALDLISSQEEAEILEYIKHYKNIGFNFQTLYETVKEYRDYLMIRLRYEDHSVVSSFLDKYRTAFEKAKKIQEKLYVATTEITQEYTSKTSEKNNWEKWLKRVFENEKINGNNRYKAFILLAFHYNSTQQLSKLQSIFDQIDVFFSQGQMYCRRLLYNYYSSRVLLHSKQNEFDEAIFYGKLSIRQENEDTLMYVNNLVSIYLKLEEYKASKDLLENYEVFYENSQNIYRRITYISYYLRSLSGLNLNKKAVNIGHYFLNKYSEEIIQYRWNHFFSSYVEVLLNSENYVEILRIEKKFQLIEREQRLKNTEQYIPNISFAVALSLYMENHHSKNELQKIVERLLQETKINNKNIIFMAKISKTLSKNLPELSVFFKSYLSVFILK